MANTFSQTSLLGYTKKKPSRHQLRCGAYYRFFWIYFKLNTIINWKQYHSDYENLYSEEEVNTIKRIKQDLENLYKNRFLEYRKILKQEEEKKYENNTI